MKFINWIKKDYKRSKIGMENVINRSIPTMVYMIYYMIAFVILSPFVPFTFVIEEYIIPKYMQEMIDNKIEGV